MQSQTKSFKMSENLDQVLDILCRVENKDVEGQLLKIERAKAFDLPSLDGAVIDAESETSINVLAQLGNDFDLGLYCNKTGQPVGNVPLPVVSKMLAVNGLERTKWLLQKQRIGHVAKHWVFTDPDTLEKLAEHDPHGYFVYAITSVLPLHLFTQHVAEDEKERLQHYILQQKIRCFENVQKLPLKDILKTNELMRRYLSFIKTSKAFKLLKFSEMDTIQITKDAWHLANFNIDLKRTMRNVVVQEFRRKRIKEFLTLADILNMRLHYEGHSNFRSQGKMREITFDDHIGLIIEDQFPGLTAFQVAMKTNSFKEKEKPKKGVKAVQPSTKTINLAAKRKETKHVIKPTFAQLLLQKKRQ